MAASVISLLGINKALNQYSDTLYNCNISNYITFSVDSLEYSRLLEEHKCIYYNTIIFLKSDVLSTKCT